MRAVVVERYGPPEVARLVERPDPVPGPGQVLVRVEASTVNSGDARIRAGRFPAGFGPVARLAFGLRGPRRPVLGNVIAGVVVAVGPPPRGRGAARLAGTPGARLEVGDRVCGMTGAAMGAHAELVAVGRARLARIPAAVSFEDAAGVLFGGSTALHYLRDKGGIRAGHRVLVIGASGAVGTSAVQLAKHAGAHVTAVTSARNAALAAELGADRVLDYRVTPPEELDERFDLVLDTVGVLSPATGRPLLSDGGRLLLVVASLGETITAHGPVKTGPAPERAENFATLLELVAEGRLRVVHEAALPLDRIAEAYALVDSGRKVGNLVVRPQPASSRRRSAQQTPERTPS
ncbi:NAD(P)-dependent alcohol dehydrogenase [Agromyces sp. NPDC060279]|uniref:NAD(P)-dependent alcohol dehydrogenase n=1 Tax=Agromyces sp. NPDC060279 TaxID=3347092 RepID=UPI003651831E